MPEESKPGGEVILYQSEDGQTRVQVRLDGQTAWLTQAQMAELFQTTPQNITLHLQAIYREGELPEAATCKDYLQVRAEGARQVQRTLRHYNLEAILAVGYRVRSARGTAFRQWATQRLKEYLVTGFALNEEKLKQEPEYFERLLAKIRDIRSSEKVFWRKVLDIYATSADYDANEAVSHSAWQARASALPPELFVQSWLQEYTLAHNLSIDKYEKRHLFFPAEGSPR
jgi:hypothetical protein